MGSLSASNLQTLLDSEHLIRAELCRRSLLHFVRAGWHVLEPGVEYVEGRVIHAICIHLEAVFYGRIQNLIINVPPGHMKSLLTAVFFPAWVWLRAPNKRFMGAAHSGDLSTRDNVRCRRLIESDWYQSLFQPSWSMASDGNLKTSFENTETGFRKSTSVGANATGFRANYLLMDDLLSAMNAHSKSARDYHVAWYNQEFGNRLNDLKRDGRVLIMQRLHEADIAGELIKSGEWELLCLPTEYEPERHCKTSIGWEDWRTTAGELLFPERFGRVEIEKEKRRLGSIGYAAQHQQRPAPAAGAIFDRAWWQRWTELPCTLREMDDVLQSWDCTFKGSDGSDYVCGQVWAIKGVRKYLLDEVRARMTFTQTVQAIKDMTAKWPEARAVLVEDKANGPAVMDTLKDQISGLIPVEPQGGKESRAHAVTATVEAGNVYLPAHASWVHDYIEEHAAFPFGVNDDRVDATTQALLRFANGPAFGEVTPVPESHDDDDCMRGF